MTRYRGFRFLTGPAAVLFVLLLVPLPLLAQAQDSGQAAADQTDAVEPDITQRGEEIMGRLDMLVAEGRHLRERQATASREDSLVLRLQLAGTRDRFMKTLNELADAVKATSGDQAANPLRQRALEVYENVTPRLWELIRELSAKIDNIRARRPATPASERSALEDELALLGGRLDDFFKYGWNHIRNLEAFGRDTEQERKDFADLVTARADALSGRMELASLRIRELGRRLKETSGDADLTMLLTANRKNLAALSRSQNITLGIMDEMQIPDRRYRTQLLSTTQDLASGLLDITATRTILRQAWNGIRTWLSEHGPSYLVKILLFLFILAAGRFLAVQVSHVVEKSLARSKVNMSNLLKRMTVTFSKNTILVLALVFGLAQLGLSLGPLLAGFGVVGFILGFAMQDSLSNLAAGMMILINRPYDVGDLVDISGVFGKVENMSMVSTSILTLDNQKLVVPNSKIWGDVIKNVTDQRVRRVDMNFGISYTDDIPHAEEILGDILAKHDRILAEPEPMVRLHTLGESSVDFVVRPWVKTEDYWDVYWDVTREVKMRFDAEGISIPFPQQDVHIYEERRITGGKAAGAGSTQAPVDPEQAPVEKTGQDEPGAEVSGDD